MNPSENIHRLRLLGPVQIEWADTTTNGGFESRKALALLCYLATQDQPMPRSHLAHLFWRDKPEARGRANLSRVLHNLTSMLPQCLEATRHAIQFKPSPELWVDVHAFEQLVAQEAPASLATAVALYQGEFMSDLFLDDSPDFENWLLLEREHWAQRMTQVLNRLVTHHTQQAEYHEALKFASQLLELERWREEVHRQVMRLLALSGQRSAALAQYDTCRRILAEELNVEPAKKTTALYKRIREGKLKSDPTEDIIVELAPPLHRSDDSPPPAPFVAREQELDQLDQFLELSLSGQGQIIFVTGEAGSGKTALIQEFSRRTQQQQPDLIVTWGNCNAYGGMGDPYLPFRQVLELLTGNLESWQASETISQEAANRLWALMPHAIEALVQAGPKLTNVFLSGPALLSRVNAVVPANAPWLADLEQLISHQEPGINNYKQHDLFEQYTRILQILARRWPLMLVLDDLQWADTGSISLLFHLGRRLKGQRILIVGAYRPADLNLGQGTKRHPLAAVVNEFQRYFGQIEVNLEQAAGKHFVEAFLDTQPNRLSTGFREALYRHTRGQALFTVETVHRMQEQGDLVQDANGLWVEGPQIDWQTLPARVEGVIGERFDRLPPALYELLKVASVEGENFTAEVVARVLGLDAWKTVRQLSSVLDQKYRLVRSQGSQQLGRQRLSSYRFHHILYQKYLYEKLDEVERAYLHEAIGSVLEQLYQNRPEEIALELARHFEGAGLAARAVEYLHRAGKRAVRLSAHEEAISHFTRGLVLLETTPDTPERTRQELTLQLALSHPLALSKGYAAAEVEQVYIRARELCQQVEGPSLCVPVLRGLWDCYLVRAEHQRAYELAQQIFTLAQQLEEPIPLMEAHWVLGETLYSIGDLLNAQTHQKEAIALYDLQQYRAYPFRSVQDPGLSSRYFYASTLWLLGYPDQAKVQIEETLHLAQELSYPFDLVSTLFFASIQHQFRRESSLVQAKAEAIIRLATKYGFILPQAWGILLSGWALTQQGQPEAGIARMHQGLADLKATGAEAGIPHYLMLLGEAYSQVQQMDRGLQMLDEALETIEKYQERWIEAEVHRVKGELLLLKDGPQAAPTDSQSAESCFNRAIEVAQKQKARSLELRAVISLSRLWHKQGKTGQAHQRLAKIYNRFTEGFQTADLQEAKALLQELAKAAPPPHK